MAVRIRLARQGAKKNPEYLVVVVPGENKRDGEYLDKLGYYYPKAKATADKWKLNNEKVQAWLAKGAQPSDTVGQFIRSTAK